MPLRFSRSFRSKFLQDRTTLSRWTLLQKNLHNRGTSTLPSGNISRSLGAKSYLQRNRGPATEWNLCPCSIFGIHDQIEVERKAEHVFFAYQTRPSNYRHSVLFTRITSNFGTFSLFFSFNFDLLKISNERHYVYIKCYSLPKSRNVEGLQACERQRRVKNKLGTSK